MNTRAVMDAILDYGDSIRAGETLKEQLARLEVVREMLKDAERELDHAEAQPKLGADF